MERTHTPLEETGAIHHQHGHLACFRLQWCCCGSLKGPLPSPVGQPCDRPPPRSSHHCVGLPPPSFPVIGSRGIRLRLADAHPSDRSFMPWPRLPCTYCLSLFSRCLSLPPACFDLLLSRARTLSVSLLLRPNKNLAPPDPLLSFSSVPPACCCSPLCPDTSSSLPAPPHGSESGEAGRRASSCYLERALHPFGCRLSSA